MNLTLCPYVDARDRRNNLQQEKLIAKKKIDILFGGNNSGVDSKGLSTGMGHLVIMGEARMAQ